MRANPWDLHSQLTADRLNRIAELLRDVYEGVLRDLSTEDDDGYTRGATFFGRSRKRLISTAQNAKHDWLKLTNSAMDVTLEIEGIPFRFFRDDHTSPKKRGFWRRNASDQLFAPDTTSPVICRFIVESPLNIDDDMQSAEVYFVGFNAQEIQVCEWRYGTVPVLQSTDDALPESVKQAPAPIGGVRSQEEIDKSGTGS